MRWCKSKERESELGRRQLAQQAFAVAATGRASGPGMHLIRLAGAGISSGPIGRLGRNRELFQRGLGEGKLY